MEGLSPAYVKSLIGLLIGGLIAVSGYATLIQSADKKLRLPLTGRILEAFGRSDTLKFVDLNAVFMLVSGSLVSAFGAISLLNSLALQGITFK